MKPMRPWQRLCLRACFGDKKAAHIHTSELSSSDRVFALFLSFNIFVQTTYAALWLANSVPDACMSKRHTRAHSHTHASAKMQFAISVRRSFQVLLLSSCVCDIYKCICDCVWHCGRILYIHNSISLIALGSRLPWACTLCAKRMREMCKVDVRTTEGFVVVVPRNLFAATDWHCKIVINRSCLRWCASGWVCSVHCANCEIRCARLEKPEILTLYIYILRRLALNFLVPLTKYNFSLRYSPLCVLCWHRHMLAQCMRMSAYTTYYMYYLMCWSISATYSLSHR